MVPGPNLRSSIVFWSCHPCSAPAAYRKLATGLEDFLAWFHDNAATATVPEQLRVLRLLIKDVLIGPDRILIRHSIPTASAQPWCRGL